VEAYFNRILDYTLSFLEFQAYSDADVCKSEYWLSVAGPQLNNSEPLTGPLATYGTESWTLNRDIAKRLATFERNVLEEYLGKLK